MSRAASTATPKPTSAPASGSNFEGLAQARKDAAARLKATGSSAKKSPKPDPALANNPLVQLLKALSEPQPKENPRSKKTSELMKLLSGLIESGAAQALAEGKPMAKDSHSALLEGLKGASSNQNLPANVQKLASSAHDFVSKHEPGPNAAKSGSKTAGIMKDAAKIMCSENPTIAGMTAVMGKMKSMGTLGKIATGAGLVTGGITAAVLGPVAGAIVGGITAGVTRGILGIGELIKAGADKLIGMAKGKSKESAKPEQPSSDLETDPTKITSASTDPNATPTPKPEPAAERKLDHEAQQSTRVDVTDPTSITSSSTAGQDQAPNTTPSL